MLQSNQLAARAVRSFYQEILQWIERDDFIKNEEFYTIDYRPLFNHSSSIKILDLFLYFIISFTHNIPQQYIYTLHSGLTLVTQTPPN